MKEGELPSSTKESKFVTADSTPLTTTSISPSEEINVVTSASLNGVAAPFTAEERVEVVVFSAVAMF